jgi:hypothetical protein
VTATGLHSRLHDDCGCTGVQHDSRFTQGQAGKVYCQVTRQQQYNVLHSTSICPLLSHRFGIVDEVGVCIWDAPAYQQNNERREDPAT